MSENCIFCKIAKGEIPSNVAYQDDKVFAFHDINPQAPKHVLIIPREHISGLSAAQPEHDALIGYLMRTAARIAAQEGITESGFRTVINNGADAGQTVFHIHVHVLGGRGLAWPPG